MRYVDALEAELDDDFLIFISSINISGINCRTMIPSGYRRINFQCLTYYLLSCLIASHFNEALNSRYHWSYIKKWMEFSFEIQKKEIRFLCSKLLLFELIMKKIRNYGFLDFQGKKSETYIESLLLKINILSFYRRTYPTRKN